MSKKFLDETGLRHLWAGLKDNFATKDEATETSAGLMSAEDKTILSQLVGGEGADTKTKQTLLAEKLDVDCPVILGEPGLKETKTQGTFFHTGLKYNDHTNTLTTNISGRSALTLEDAKAYASESASATLESANEYTDTAVGALEEGFGEVIMGMYEGVDVESTGFMPIAELTSTILQQGLNQHANNASHMSDEDRAALNTAKVHINTTHAPSNAEANQNAFSNVKVGSTTIAADTKTDTLEIASGDGISVTGDATGDKVTIANEGVITVSPGTTVGSISVNTGGTTKDVMVTGLANLGSAAFTDATSYARNAFSGVVAGETVLNATSPTSCLDVWSGSGIDIEGDAEHNKLTIINTGVTSVSEGRNNGTIAIVQDSTYSDIPVKGLGSAAYTNTDAYPVLDSNKKIPTTYLPSYVDDVVEGALSTFPTTGETGKIYVDTTTNKTYRWSGSAYVEISASLALGETSSTAYRGDRGKTAYEHSQAAHAPSNAQKNSDITKAEIEAKLTGTITSHSHNYAAASHVGDATHITSAERTNWNAAKTHADSAHAPAGAEVNQNAFSNVKVGSTTIAADTKTDTLELVAGSNVTITPDATNDKVTISATDTVYTHPTYTSKSSGLYKVAVDGTGHVSETTAVAKSDITALGIPAQDTTYSNATTSADGLMSSEDKTKLNYTNIAYGTCDTAAATAAKVITVSGNTNWALTAGSRITVKFTNTNTASNPTFNVNGTGAKSVWYGTSLITTSSLSYAGYANRPMEFVYDGTQYIFVGWSYNTSYSNASLGQGYGTCSTAAATVAKTVSLSSYTLATGGIVAVKFTNSVPASATMNINGKGAKPIYYKGAAIKAGIIEAGDVAVFVYNGSQYHLLTVDRHRVFSTLVPYGTAIPANANLNTTEYLKVGNYYCSKTADAGTLANCPEAIAFMMQVYSPLSVTIDNESSAWVYRLRKITTYKGNEYYQYVYAGATAGEFTYDSWIKNINAKDTATTAKAGLMSKDDKSKLDGIATGANKTTVDTAMSSSSTNPVQNKVVNTAIDTALTSAKAYTDEKFEAMGGVVPDYVKDEANRVAKNVQSHQNANTFSFFAFSDAHYDKTNANIVNGIIHAGQAMDLIRNAVNIDFAVHLGDATWGSSMSGDETSLSVGREEIMEVNKIIAPAFKGIPNFRVHGNHDHLAFNYELNGNDYIDENELFASFGIYNRGATYPVGEKDRGYCYRDLDEFKLRVIVMNTNDIKGCTIEEMENPCMSGYQMQWFADSLDLSSKSDASEWSILIFSHQPLDFGISILCNNILKAYLEGGSYSNSRNGVDFSCNFAGKNAATVIGNIHGHNHNFVVDNLNEYVSGGTASPINIKRMCVPNACYERSNERGEDSKDTDVFGIDFGEAISYHKTAGTANDTAFYVITVDTATKKMYLDHYGAGYSRITSYVVQGVTYTNLLPTAEVYTAGDHSVLDGVGYRDGYYMSSSGGVGSAASGYTCTGAIPYARKADGTYPTIYVKGATFEATSQSRIYLYANDVQSVPKLILAPASYGGSGASPANVNKLWTKEELDDGYWRFVPTAEFNAMEYVNNNVVGYVGMSLKGSGANTIITLDEPIEEGETDEDVILGGNWIPKATTEYGGTEIYNGIGYKPNTRMSSSGTIVEKEGMCLSGWIPVTEGDVIRVKNITIEGSESPYIVRMALDGAVTVMYTSYLGDPDENGVYTMTITSDIRNMKAIRLSVGVIDETSILTINEEIV